MRPFIETFAQDRADLSRYYNVRNAQDRRERFRRLYQDWEARLASMNFDAMNEDGQVDYVLFRNFLDHALKQLDFEGRQEADSAAYVPFATTIIGLEESRRNGHPVDSQASAAALSQLQHQIEALEKEIAKPPAKTDFTAIQKRRIDANRAADEVELLKQTLHRWYVFYDNYDRCSPGGTANPIAARIPRWTSMSDFFGRRLPV
ncbi:MAG TPA: hypothetical protein VHZ07_22965 [Bryobacteraceae bacterium]|jgi:hypothetical protein|nr:hypothetical protein [Bryobacteraceae bacterium]